MNNYEKAEFILRETGIERSFFESIVHALNKIEREEKNERNKSKGRVNDKLDKLLAKREANKKKQSDTLTLDDLEF